MSTPRTNQTERASGAAADPHATERRLLTSRESRVPPAARDALDRTMLLMRDDIPADVPSTRLLDALLAPRVVLAADAANLASAAAQSALVATTLLFLRTGASVMLDAPDLPLVCPQPPLVGTHLISALVAAGASLIEGVICSGDVDRAGACDIAVVFGDTPWRGASPFVLVVTADARRTTMRAFTSAAAAHGERWARDTRVPFGALAGAGLAASEGFKFVMRRLRDVAVNPALVDALYAVSADAQFAFDAHGGSLTSGAPNPELDAQLNSRVALGEIDAISAGAIIQSSLFALARMPAVIPATVRLLEPERSDASNLNRYALLLAAALGERKVDTLAAMDLGALRIEPFPVRYTWESLVMLSGHAPSVLVGVDHIPTRWTAQRARPEWLGVGATSHHSAMSSEHGRGAPCARCLHPEDSSAPGNIPTVAFVSHWAGLLLAWRLVRHRLGIRVDSQAQHDYLTPLRTDFQDAMWRSAVASRAECPNRCGRHRRAA